MYEFRPISDRVERLRIKVRDRVIIADASKDRIRLDAQEKYHDFPPILERAYVTKYIIDHMHYEIRDDEFLAGDLGHKNWGDSSGLFWVMMADIENTWPIEADGLHHAPDDDPFYSHQKMAISPEDVKALREIRAIEVKIEVTDLRTGRTFHRTLPIDYRETSNILRLGGENAQAQDVG